MGDWLRVRGAAEGLRLDVDDELAVGRRQPGLGALADDDQLSRRHARFTRTESGGLTVEDLGSSNGTFVNGKRVSGRAELRPGDVVRLGATELEVVGDRPPRAERRAPEPRPPAPPPPPAASRPPFPSTAPAPRERDPRIGVLAALLVLALAGLGVSLVFNGDEAGSAFTVAREPAYEGTAYALTNRRQAGQNSVIAVRYGAAGFDPLRLREYPTGGAGSRAEGLGAPIDGDQQIQIDRKRRLLFAVNQGSDTVAVFHIRDDGGLEPVEGSPFPSGGTGPISVGLSDATVLVVNKGYDGRRKLDDPGSVAQLQLGDEGSLTPKGQPIRIDRGAGPPQALVIDRADLVVVPELVTGPYRTLRRSDDGTFRPGPTTPVTQAQRALGTPLRQALGELLGSPARVPPRLPPAPQGAEGLSVHPEQDIIYSELPPLSLLMVHTFDRSGRLRFVRGVKIQGGLLACWSKVSPDGRWLYVANAGTHTIAVFDLRAPRNPRQVQSLQLGGGGGHTSNLEFDSTGRRLFAIDTFEPSLDDPGVGNQVHVLDVGDGGRLSIPRRGPLAKLPVLAGTSSYGLAVMPRVAPSESESD